MEQVTVAPEPASRTNAADAGRARRDATRLALPTIAIAILALCVCLHVYRLNATPGWDPQEGYNLDIAWNLAHGRLRLFALTTAFAQHPPLFYLQLVLSFRIFGYSILAVRAVAATYAVLTCAALLAVGRRILGWGPALWAGAVFCVAPIALANTRWGYSYAQLMFVGVVCLGAAWRWLETGGDRRWLVAAALLAGLAAFSDYEGVAWLLFVALLPLALRHGWRESVLALGMGACVPIIGLLVCFIVAPAAFTADAVDTFGRAAGGNLVLQGIALLVNYYRFLSLDVWVLLGVVGLFLVWPARARTFLLGAVATLALTVLKVRGVGTSFHTAVPLLPLLALGAGVSLDLALRTLYGWCVGWVVQLLPGRDNVTQEALRPPYDGAPRLAKLAATALVFVVVVAPVGLALASDGAGLASSLSTRQDTTLGSPVDASATAHYIAGHARPGDLVLASPEIAWMVDAPDSQPALRGADLLQTLAQAGQSAAFYPSNLPRSRWSYDVSLTSARYVIVDDLLRQLEKPGQVDALAPLLAQVKRWPAVYTSGQYTVYERPCAA